MRLELASILEAVLSATHFFPHQTIIQADPSYGQSPPVYPSPIGNGTTDATWASAYRRARSLTSQMTLTELANLTRGFPGPCAGNSGAVPRLSVPSFCFADAPAGVKGHEFASSFPAGIHLAATFDRTLMRSYGEALGAEFRGKGVHVALGPVAGPMGRIARGGRNWEGFGPDPYLAAAGLGSVTAGVQGAGVMACPKHWLLNEQEFRRRPDGMGEAVSANVDDRTLHELYAFPFMEALRQGAAAIMCSYQRANNSYACQNSKLLNGVLKTEMGFEGFVLSDWDAQQAGVATAEAGMDVVMPGEGFWGNALIEAVRNGTMARHRLEDMATRLLAGWYRLGQDEGYPPVADRNPATPHLPVDVQRDHAKLIREIGAAGTVLVKNVNCTLPLRDPRFLSVYGYDATVPAVPWDLPDRFGGGYAVNFGWSTLNGTLVTAGGSGGNTPPYVVSPFQALQERVVAAGGILRWDFWSENPPIAYANSDACLVFINAYASESFDRTSLTDGFSDRLVANVAGKCGNTVVVIHSAGIRVVDAWIDHPNVTAVVFAGLPGQESGHSLVDVLYGDVNPSGRLPYTVAKKETDYGHLLNSTMSFDTYPQDDFTEGLYIDYRAFDKQDIAPRFEFGFGLSYTTFGYDKLVISSTDDLMPGVPDSGVETVQGGHPQLWDVLVTLSCEITNTGTVAGFEVAQLYLGIPDEDTPRKQLRGFGRVFLGVGESRTVEFSLSRRDLSIWDVVRQQWRLLEGSYTVQVGASSRDIRLHGTFAVDSRAAEL